MKLMYLGTGASEGVPAVFCNCSACKRARAAGGREVRTRSGALLDGVLKIDFPADAYMQELKYGLDYSSLRYVLITHTHSDHFCPKEFGNRKKPFSQLPLSAPPLQVYGNESGEKALLPMLEEGVLEYNIVNEYEEYVIGGYKVTPLPAIHDPNQQSLFYYIEKDGQALLYAHDTDEFTPEHFAFLKDKKLSIVSLDCTNGILDGDYVGHMGIADDLRMREALLRLGAANADTRFVANHFSHNGILSHEEMEKRLPGFTVAYDGLTVEA